MSETLTVLTGDASKKAEGESLRSSQQRATAEGFDHVAKVWYKQTMSYDQGLDLIAKGKAETEDIIAPLNDFTPHVGKNDNFVFLYKDGREFVPTGHAANQIAVWADVSTWLVGNLRSDKLNQKGRKLYGRDRGDAETLAHVFQNGLRERKDVPALDRSKKFLWRTRKDGTLRAFLTTQYAIINNLWFVEKLREFIPGGRLSHWRGDSDTIWANVLIPDTIREESDSDYGGMLSAGNSEIGERRVVSVPSIFRHICMNGCIWGATIGKGIRQVHKGKVDLNSLAFDIKEKLNKQIPLLPQGIDRLLGTRSYAWDGCSAKPVIAQLAFTFKLSKKEANEVIKGYNKERAAVPDTARTLFGITNAVTRAGQSLSNEGWEKFDKLGGELTEYSQDDFNTLVNKAKALKVKEVEEAFSETLTVMA